MKQSYKEKYGALLKEFEQYKLESIKWGVSDFTEYELPGWQISKEQAQDALERMIHNHDCNYGIDWNSIEYYISLYGDRVEEETESWRNK